jgi:hypothetical protein
MKTVSASIQVADEKFRVRLAFIAGTSYKRRKSFSTGVFL